MSSRGPASEASVAGTIRTGQILVLAMAVGVISFGGFLVFYRLGGDAQPVAALSEIAAGLAVGAIVLSFLVPRRIHQRNLERIAAGQYRPAGRMGTLDEPVMIASSRLTSLIVAGALLEGAALVNLVAYMANGSRLSLAVAGVLVLILLSHFPRQLSWEQSLADDQRVVADARSQGR